MVFMFILVYVQPYIAAACWVTKSTLYIHFLSAALAAIFSGHYQALSWIFFYNLRTLILPFWYNTYTMALYISGDLIRMAVLCLDLI